MNRMSRTPRTSMVKRPVLWAVGVLLILLLAACSETLAPTPAKQGALTSQAVLVGTVVGWGYDGVGQTDVPAGLSNVVAISAGGRFGLALKSDGTVVGWGDDFEGQTDVPAGLSNVTAIAAGYQFSLALKDDGTVVGWGNDDDGQTDVPAGLSNVTAIAAGHNHSLALKSDGTVVGWGNDFYGQTNVPAAVQGHVLAIAAGYDFSLALKDDGTVVASGNDFYGQTDVPAGLSNVTAIAAGRNHSLALKSDGTVVGWGLDDDGQTDVPATLSDVVAIAAGEHHSLALKSDGTVVGWGYDGDGQTDVPAAVQGHVLAIAARHSFSLALVSTDTTPPTASPTQSPPANASGWNNANVTVTWNWSGEAGGSGLDTSNCTTSSTSSGEGTLVLNATCKDLAGNQGTASYTVKVDTTPPTLNPVVTPNPVTLNGTASVVSNASDALSGLASQSCGSLDTSSVGSKSVSCTATDKAGNSASRSVTYQVIYAFSGFDSPIANLPTVNKVKAGRAIPVKFSLGGDFGLNILASGSPSSRQVACDSGAPESTVVDTVTAGHSGLQYDADSDTYTYVWKTDKGWGGTCRQLSVTLNDGTTHTALFKFR